MGTDGYQLFQKQLILCSAKKVIQVWIAVKEAEEMMEEF